MPFEIIRSDIVNMDCDAIVNTANPLPQIGWGCDAGIHAKAGPRLLEARKKIGPIAVGDAAITKGYDLAARYVIHAVGPVWQGGGKHEEELLRRCYDKALALARKKGCKSVAFPLMSAGNHGFPKPLALQIAINAFSAFLMQHEMRIYLVVFSRDAFALSEKLFHSVESYIDENYIRDKKFDEYGVHDKCQVRDLQQAQIIRAMEAQRYAQEAKNQDMSLSAPPTSPCASPCAAPSDSGSAKDDLELLLKNSDAGFSRHLMQLIDRSGKKDSEIYKKANVDRKHFSKIRSNPSYRPGKATALAFAIALELDLDETRDLIGRAGFALNHNDYFDIIVEFFIKQRNYDIFQLNATLFHYDLPLIGG